MYVYVYNNNRIIVSLKMLAVEINSNNNKHNNKSKRVLHKIYTKKSPNSNSLNLITLQGHKVM